MERRGDKTSEVARRRLELLARELRHGEPQPPFAQRRSAEPHAGAGGPVDDPADDLFAGLDLDDLDALSSGVDEAGPPDDRDVLHVPQAAATARHRAGAYVSPRAWSEDVQDRMPPRLRSVLGQGTTPAHVLVLVLVVLVAGGGVLWWVQRAQPQTVASDPVAVQAGAVTGVPTVPSPGPVGSPPPAGTPSAEVVVDVAGKVRRPGIVTLPGGSRVVDALEAAGGARRGADLTPLNLARLLVDGEQIVVGLPPVAGAPVDGTGGGSGPTGPGAAGA
ncbi:SLBB domain-containing protein, partial [Mumia zhuanghuii]